MWEWTLNWNEIREDLLIGSCPITPEDILTVRDKAHATAVLSLQHEECWQRFSINYPAQADLGRRLGMAMSHSPLRDFDPAHQRRHLAKAVGCLHQILSEGHRVYVHCTAGINRAPLVILGYLSLVEMMPETEAIHFIRRNRPEAQPYWEAFHGCRQDMARRLEQEIGKRALLLFQSKPENPSERLWLQAEAELIRESLIGRGDSANGISS